MRFDDEAPKDAQKRVDDTELENLENCYQTLALKVPIQLTSKQNLALEVLEKEQKRIEKAYRKLSRTKHPDKGGSEEDFKKISNAKEFLIKHLETIKEDL